MLIMSKIFYSLALSTVVFLSGKRISAGLIHIRGRGVSGRAMLRGVQRGGPLSRGAGRGLGVRGVCC